MNSLLGQLGRILCLLVVIRYLLLICIYLSNYRHYRNTCKQARWLWPNRYKPLIYQNIRHCTFLSVKRKEKLNLVR